MEKQNTMMGHALSDDTLETVSGGAVVKPPQLFQLDDSVKVVNSTNGKFNYGRVTDCDYDEELGQWTYQVEFGRYEGYIWVSQGPTSGKYYLQTQLSHNVDHSKDGYCNT